MDRSVCSDCSIVGDWYVTSQHSLSDSVKLGHEVYEVQSKTFIATFNKLINIIRVILLDKLTTVFLCKTGTYKTFN